MTINADVEVKREMWVARRSHTRAWPRFGIFIYTYRCMEARNKIQTQ